MENIHVQEINMSLLDQIITDPYRRTKASYHFKVTALDGNTIGFHDASRVTNLITLPNDTEQTLEEQYRDGIDNLFLSVDITGQYFFYNKVSNTDNWPM
jgi:hypothetical protein